MGKAEVNRYVQNAALFFRVGKCQMSRPDPNFFLLTLDIVSIFCRVKKMESKEGEDMECRSERNKRECTCTYEPCSRKGICCECVSYHRAMNELPGCFFSPKSEATYNRSVNAFIRDQQGR